MTAWMLYSALCAVAFSLAAFSAERVLLGRAPVRMIWVAAVGLSLLLPILAYGVAVRSVSAAEPVEIAPSPSFEPFTAAAAGPAGVGGDGAVSTASRGPDWTALSRFDTPIGVAWAVLSIALLLNLLGGLVTIGLMRRRWEEQAVLGIRVFVSDDIGPAVVGVLSPMIVVPRWVLELPRRQLELMLRHEEEHRRAGDGRLLALVELALIAMPWNVALWWQVRCLRAAVEWDCDGRVLRDFDARSYGDLLVEMARRGRGPRLMGAIAFAERAVHLERRIRLLARRSARASRGAFALACAIGIAAVTIAWVSPRPPAVERAPDSALSERLSIPQADSGALPAAQSAAEPRPTGERPLPTSEPTPTSDVPAGLTANSEMPPSGVPASACALALTARAATPLVDSAFTRVFAGMTLSQDQRADACLVLAGLEDEQRAQEAAVRSAASNSVTDGIAIRVRRDSVLLSIVPGDAARSALAARLAPGARGGGANSAGARAGDGAPGVARMGGAGRAAGGGGGTQDAASVAADATLRRLFDGIELTDAQRAEAHAVILEAQQALSALRPTQPVLLRLSADGTVSMRAPADTELVDLLSNDGDRSIVRSRIVSVPL
jgi:hypothetical protein